MSKLSTIVRWLIDPQFLMVLYALFGLRRFKIIELIQVDGVGTELLLYIILGYFLLKGIVCFFSSEKKVNLTKYETNIAIILFF